MHNLDKKENYENKIYFTEIIKIMITLLPTLSVICTILFKFASMGTAWYYQFDFNYCDFSISNADLFVLIFTITTITLTIIITHLVFYWQMKLINNRKIRKVIAKLQKTKIFTGFKIKRWIADVIVNVLSIGTIILIFGFIIKSLFVYKIIIVYYLMLAILSYGFTLIFLPKSGSLKRFVNSCVVLCSLMALFIFAILFKVNYDTAKDNRNYQIINYSDIVSENELDEELYVVISYSKKGFSAYKCDIDSENLIVYKDYHKYFDTSTDYEIYTFKTIEYIESRNIYKDGNFETVTNTYQIQSDYDS